MQDCLIYESIMNFNTIEKVTSSMTKCSECEVRHTSLFKKLSNSSLEKAEDFRQEQLIIPARTRFFQEGEKHDYVYTVFSGWGLIYKTVSNSGKRQILQFLLPGDLIGFQTNTSGVMPHSAGSVTELVLCSYPRDDFKPMLEENPEVALRMVDIRSRDVTLCQNHLMAAGRKTAKESIAFIILELFYRVQHQVPANPGNTKSSIDFPITQEDIGDAIGLTNVHVNRVIKELMDEGLIYCNKKRLEILDEKKLSEIAEFNSDMVIAHPMA